MVMVDEGKVNKMEVNNADLTSNEILLFD